MWNAKRRHETERYRQMMMYTKSIEIIFFLQAEDGIRHRRPSRGLGDVYKRQFYHRNVQPPHVFLRALKACYTINFTNHLKSIYLIRLLLG